MLLPAGEALRAVHAEGTPAAFAGDRFHPSVAGTCLAALVITGALTRRSTEGLSLIRPILDLPDFVAARLERAADQANRQRGIP